MQKYPVTVYVSHAKPDTKTCRICGKAHQTKATGRWAMLSDDNLRELLYGTVYIAPGTKGVRVHLKCLEGALAARKG